MPLDRAGRGRYAQLSMTDDLSPFESLLDLATESAGLKDVARTGWLLRGVQNAESVADHCWGTAFLSLLFIKHAGNVNRGLVLSIAVVHDLAEVRTGDIPRRVNRLAQPISPEEKRTLEAEAMAKIAQSSPEILEMWREYEDAQSLEARYVRDMNLIDMCLQALIYERDRRYDPAFGNTSFPDFAAMDEFFATTEPRLMTDIGRRLYDEVLERYRSERDSRASGGNATS